MNTEEHDKNYQKIIARAWADAEFAERLSSDPKGALAEQGIEVPDEFEVKVTHANANELHIIIPPNYQKIIARAWADAEFAERAGRFRRARRRGAGGRQRGGGGGGTAGTAGTVGSAGSVCGTIATFACVGTAGSAG